MGVAGVAEGAGPIVGVIVVEKGIIRRGQGRGCIIIMSVIFMTITVGEERWIMKTFLRMDFGLRLSVDGVVTPGEDLVAMLAGEGGIGEEDHEE